MGQVVGGNTLKKEASPKRNTVEGSGFSSLSTGDVLDKLVHASPRAHVELAGVPASVVLDTGAETSLYKCRIL